MKKVEFQKGVNLIFVFINLRRKFGSWFGVFFCFGGYEGGANLCVG